VTVAPARVAEQNPRMGERPARRRRVLIEDARRNGHHLRATWHPETRQFVLSTWSADVCTGSARLAVDDVAELTGLLVDGLGEAATAPPPAGVPPTRPGLGGLVDRLRWLVRGTSPTPAPPTATVRPLRRRTA
jgi:hypothetical protein